MAFDQIKELETGVFQTPYIIPTKIEHRRQEFDMHLIQAQKRLKVFAKKYHWEQHIQQPFVYLAEVYDSKQLFDQRLLYLADADPTTQLPATFTAGLEKNILFTVTPELYFKLYSEGQEEKAFEKLITHELAHRLHVRILNGDEDKMGPVWFFEAFATFAAEQFPDQTGDIAEDKVWEIVNAKNRGSYQLYNQVIKFFLKKMDLLQLVQQAGNDNFTEWLKSL